MKVLVINSGSSSLKYELFDMNTEKSLMSGAVSRIGMEGSEHKYECSGNENRDAIEAPDHLSALKAVLHTLTSATGSPIAELSEISAVAHRVGHVLTEKTRLHQESEFAAQETVNLTGPRGTQHA